MAGLHDVTLEPDEFHVLQEIEKKLPYPFSHESKISFTAEARHVVRIHIMTEELRRPIRLPENLGALRFLKILDLSEFPLKNLPTSIGSLHALEELYLVNTHLQTLPESLGGLTSLRILNLGGNAFTGLPASVEKLARLEKFVVHSTSLESLPETIAGWANLQCLEMTLGDTIFHLPDAIGQLPRLKENRLSQMLLKEVPASIGNLPALTTLGLSFNQLEVLPDTLGNLPLLRVLFLNHNRL